MIKSTTKKLTTGNLESQFGQTKLISFQPKIKKKEAVSEPNYYLNEMIIHFDWGSLRKHGGKGGNHDCCAGKHSDRIMVLSVRNDIFPIKDFEEKGLHFLGFFQVPLGFLIFVFIPVLSFCLSRLFVLY